MHGRDPLVTATINEIAYFISLDRGKYGSASQDQDHDYAKRILSTYALEEHLIRHSDNQWRIGSEYRTAEQVANSALGVTLEKIVSPIRQEYNRAA